MRTFLVIAFVCISALILISLTVGSSTPIPENVTASGLSTRSVECTAADFLVTKTKARTEYDQATLTGIITSHCKYAAGVQLKWTAFNSDGSVAFSDDFWPASTTNIPPGTEYPFEMMNESPRGKWTYTVQPISVSVW